MNFKRFGKAKTVEISHNDEDKLETVNEHDFSQGLALSDFKVLTQKAEVIFCHNHFL